MFFELPDGLSVTTCLDEEGFGVFDLTDVASQINPNLQVISYYNTLLDAENGAKPISAPNSYPNVAQNEVVFIRVLNPSNCTVVKGVLLLESTENLGQIFFRSCLGKTIAAFNVQGIKNLVADTLNNQEQNISLFETENNAISQSDEILSEFLDIDNNDLPLSIFLRLDAAVSCEGLAELILNISNTIEFLEDINQFLICVNDTIELSASVENYQGEISYIWNNGENTESIAVEEPGNYNVEVTGFQIIDGQEVASSIVREFTVIASGLPEVTYT